MTFQPFATLCAAIFTGAAIPHQPRRAPRPHVARYRCSLGGMEAVRTAGLLMQAPLAIAGLAAALGAWAIGGGRAWLLGGLVLGAVVPVHTARHPATNEQLQRLDPAAEGDLDRALALLERWNRLHAVRSLLSLTALVIFLVLLR